MKRHRRTSESRIVKRVVHAMELRQRKHDAQLKREIIAAVLNLIPRPDEEYDQRP